MKAERKVFLLGGLVTFLIIGGGIIFLSSTQKKETTRSKKPLIGQAVQVLSSKHVPDGTKITFNSNPPAAGAHYQAPQDAGIYTTPQSDGHLVHSLEHSAIILWYNPKLVTQAQITALKTLFTSIQLEKTILTPRNNLDVPLALTSWGRLLKLKTIDVTQIKTFFNTNYDRGSEQAPI